MQLCPHRTAPSPRRQIGNVPKSLQAGHGLKNLQLHPSRSRVPCGSLPGGTAPQISSSDFDLYSPTTAVASPARSKLTQAADLALIQSSSRVGRFGPRPTYTSRSLPVSNTGLRYRNFSALSTRPGALPAPDSATKNISIYIIKVHALPSSGKDAPRPSG